MPRWLLWTPLAVLIAATGFFGLREGLRYASVTESHVIEAAAQAYLAQGGARSASDCAARPAERGGVWLTVICTPSTGKVEQFFGLKSGRITRAAPAASTVPET